MLRTLLSRWFARFAVPPSWSPLLARALPQVLGVPLPHVDYGNLVASLSGRHLLALDRLLRAQPDGLGRDTLSARAWVDAVATGSDAPLALFVVGCHWNGFVREAALRAMHAVRGPLPLALALLRSDDAIKEVRSAAVALLVQRMSTDPIDALFRRLDLVHALRARERFSAAAWSLVESVLLDPRNAGERWSAAHSQSPVIRRFAWSLVEHADTDVFESRLDEAASDPDARLAHWALERARDTAAFGRVVEVAERNPMPSVRAAALRLRAAREGAAIPHVEQALFDSAHAVRNAAVVLSRGTLEPLSLWRDALYGSDQRRKAIALLALSEYGTHEDMPVLLAALEHPRRIERVAALRGIVRLDPDQAAMHHRALEDPSPAVARAAFALARRIGLRVPVERLDTLRSKARSTAAIAQLASNAVHLVGKWPGLELLLRWVALDDNDAWPWLARALDQWCVDDARAQIPIPADLAFSLADALMHARPAHPEWPRWPRLAFVLRSSVDPIPHSA